MDSGSPTTYVRVDLLALRHNYAEVARLVAGRAALMPVVKANAYGHGLVETARLFADLGCAGLGVASVDEGLRLRDAGLTLPVLVFHPAMGDELAAAGERRLTVTLTQPEHVDALAAQTRPGEYEVAVDVGLGRSGCRDDPAEFLRRTEARLGRRASGVWTHLGPGMAPADLPAPPPASWSAARSVAERLRYLEALRAELPDHPPFHVAASAALSVSDRLLWDRVRVGSLLYGVHPPGARRSLSLLPALELRARIVEVRVLPPGAAVGYGGEFRTRRVTRLATLPVGLSHGVGIVPESAVSPSAAVRRTLARALGQWGKSVRPSLVRIGDARAPIVGRISLNECTVDVTDVPSAQLGTEVTVPARLTTLNPNIRRRYHDGS